MTYYESFYEAVRLEGNAWMSRYTADVNEELRCVLITRTTPTARMGFTEFESVTDTLKISIMGGILDQMMDNGGMFERCGQCERGRIYYPPVEQPGNGTTEEDTP